MSITDRPTSYGVVSGTSSGWAAGNYNDNNLSTSASIASSGATHGIVNMITYSTGNPQTNTNGFTFHFYSQCTIGVGDTTSGSVTFSYSTDGGSNWNTLGTITADDGSATDHSYSITYSGTWLSSSSNLKTRVDCLSGVSSGIPPTYFVSTCQVYEMYVTYSGYCSATTDQAAVTASPTPVYASGSFSTSGCTAGCSVSCSFAGVGTTGTVAYTSNGSAPGPFSFYRLTDSTENA